MKPGQLNQVLKISVAALALLTPSPCEAMSSLLDPDTATDSQSIRFIPAADPTAPIIVGPREVVGKQSMADKAVSGAIRSVLGGSSKKSKGPKTVKDPTRKSDWSKIKRDDGDLQVRARTKLTDEGLLVSNKVEDWDGKGTFQTIFLQDCSGRRLYPTGHAIYEIWSESSVSVSWSKTSTANGQVVSRESGGWQDNWTEDWSVVGEAGETTAEMSPEMSRGIPAMWQQAGYSRAHAGVRQAGSTFNVDYGAIIQAGGLELFVHVTYPKAEPVTTEAFSWLVSARDDGDIAVAEAAPDREAWLESCELSPAAGETSAVDGAAQGQVPGEDDRRTAPADGESAAAGAKPPCKEALLSVEEKKSAYLAKLNDPATRLQAAINAADHLGKATRDHGQNLANLAAAQAMAAMLQAELDAWDQWFEEKLKRLEQHRLETHGSREPAFAKGSSGRARARHGERTAELRQQLAAQQQAVAAAQQAANASAEALQSAQNSFNQAQEDFRRALADLRNAKDEFAELAILHFRCSPCEVLAKHWSSVARLKDMLNKLKGMLDQAIADTAAQLQQARLQAAAAAQRAGEARARVDDMSAERSRIEQAMRDAVRTGDGDCLSFEPQQGWGWVNLASVDGARVSVVAQGAGMVSRSSFKGSEVRVYNKPGCLHERIERINWRKINELNNELADLDAQQREAEEAAIEAQRQAAGARAAADGLQAQLDALNALKNALIRSGLEKNTDQVMQALEEVAQDCIKAIKEAVDGIAEERRRKQDADDRVAAGNGMRSGLRRRAGRAADDLDKIDPSPGDDSDVQKHGKLKDQAEGLRDASGDGRSVAPKAKDSLPDDAWPDNTEDAERQREAAKDAADAAEDWADTLERENQDLADEVSDLEDETNALRDRVNDWRAYHAALARYEDCLRKKQKAAEELAELNRENASALEELARLLGEAADGLSEVAGEVGEAGKLDKRARDASKKAGALSGKLQRLSNAMEILDAVLRAEHKTPAEKLAAMSLAFEELRQWLPDIPGVSEMLEFYNEAMKAIAGKMGEIEDRMTESWADLVEAGIADPEDAPSGIREEVGKVARIREFMRLLGRNCGKSPQPP